MMYYFGCTSVSKKKTVFCLNIFFLFTVIEKYMTRSHKYLNYYVFVSLDQLIFCIN